MNVLGIRWRVRARAAAAVHHAILPAGYCNLLGGRNWDGSESWEVRDGGRESFKANLPAQPIFLEVAFPASGLRNNHNEHFVMRKKYWKRAVLAALAVSLSGSPARAQAPEMALLVPSGLRGVNPTQLPPSQFLSYARFTIPFDVDRNSEPPREIRLWVSPDSGSSWIVASRATAEQRTFEFHAAREGEYLFAVQAVDARGGEALGGGPPMRVVIDTTQPNVVLRADLNARGDLVIDYELADPHLDLRSLKLSYSIDGAQRWPTLALDNFQREGSLVRGQTELTLPHCREVELRMSVADLAQNVGESSLRYVMPRTAAAGGLQFAGHRDPHPTAHPGIVFGGQAGTAQHLAAPAPASPWQVPATGLPAPPPPPASPGSQHPTGQPNFSGLQQSTGLQATPGATAWLPPTSRATLAPQLGRPTAAVSGGATANSLSPYTLPSTALPSTALPSTALPSTALPSIGTAPRSGAHFAETSGGSRSPWEPPTDARLSNWNTAEARAYEELPPPQPEPSRTTAGLGPLDELWLDAPSVPSQPAGPAESGLGAQPPYNDDRLPFDTLPTDRIPTDRIPAQQLQDARVQGDLPRQSGRANPQAAARAAFHSRSRSFSLDYTVEAIHGGAVAAIELWGTEDLGRTWQMWGADPDRQSPFDVQVGNDGMFGFRMVIVGSNGVVSNRPNDGDDADTWIHVDTDKPAVKLTRALYGEGPDSGWLLVGYTCRDNNLHEQPIQLSYSERADGPWITIASGLPNSGEYRWKPDPNLPNIVYLRVEAVDLAGNRATHQLDLPVDLRGLTPRGRIQGFRPIDP
jgi:hypothetical protein